MPVVEDACVGGLSGELLKVFLHWELNNRISDVN